METLKIDGSIGHGDGQILRSALALSAILGNHSKCTPFERIATNPVCADSIFAVF